MTIEMLPINPAVLTALGVEFAKIEKLFERTQAQRPAPARGSDIAVDDSTLKPFHLSHVATASLGTAAEHMHALRALVADAHVVHPQAPFTLLRAAVENASTAVWLLAPADREERQFRRLRLRWAEVCDKLKAEELLGQPGRKTRQDHVDRLHGIARSCGFDQSRIAAVTARPIGYRSVVSEAAAGMPTAFGPMIEAIWMVCSGIAHGRTWASLSLLDKADTGSPVDGIRSLQMSASNSALVIVTRIATEVINYGWYLLNKKCKTTPPSSASSTT